jgi:hypothetical protein
MTDCRKEFPASWFKRAKLSPDRARASLNYFGANASQPLAEWRRKGWIHFEDPRGWFQWYCRYVCVTSLFIGATNRNSSRHNGWA